MKKWSCSVQAAAKVMGITTEELVEDIGHDGSRMVFPDLKEPMNHAGFHIQEIQDAAVRRNFAVITVEMRPQATPNGVNVREVFTPEEVEERMKWYMFYFNGIAVGQKRGYPTWHYNVWLNSAEVWLDAGGRELKNPNIAIAYFYAFVSLNSKR